MTDSSSAPSSARARLVEVRRLPDEQALRLTWSDEHVAEMPYVYLRGYCPCAGCQGHTNEAIVFRAPAAPVEPVEIAPVGNYALSIRWSDGHGTGIYRFDFLRALSPERWAPGWTPGDPDPPPFDRL